MAQGSSIRVVLEQKPWRRFSGVHVCCRWRLVRCQNHLTAGWHGPIAQHQFAMHLLSKIQCLVIQHGPWQQHRLCKQICVFWEQTRRLFRPQRWGSATLKWPITFVLAPLQQVGITFTTQMVCDQMSVSRTMECKRDHAPEMLKLDASMLWQTTQSMLVLCRRRVGLERKQCNKPYSLEGQLLQRSLRGQIYWT